MKTARILALSRLRSFPAQVALPLIPVRNVSTPAIKSLSGKLDRPSAKDAVVLTMNGRRLLLVRKRNIQDEVTGIVTPAAAKRTLRAF